MAKIYNYITINYTKDVYIPSIDVVQGDTGRGIVAKIADTIADFSTAIGSLTATLRVQKPNGELGSTTGTVSAMGENYIRVIFEPSTTYAALIDVAGEAKGRIEIANNTEIVSSFDVVLNIKENKFLATPTVRKFDVNNVHKITGIQQYEHNVQSIQFVGLNYTGDAYIVLENDSYNADTEIEGYNNTIPLTNYTLVIGQPMTYYSGVFNCQLFGETTSNGETTKFEISPVFQIVIDESLKQGEETQYPIDPNVKIGIDEYIENTLADYVALEQATYNAYPTKSKTGNPIYIDDGADSIPVKELIVNLEPKQSGTGDPSPTNVRPITGYDSVNVTVNEEVYSIIFPSSVGTVYGGTLNTTTGELVVDRYKMTVDGSKLPSISPLTNNYRVGIMNVVQLFNAPPAKYDGNNTVAIGNWLPKRNQGYSADTTGFYFYSNSSIYVFFPKSLIASQDLELAKQYFIEHPLDICYELETPQTYQLTPTEITTLLGNNTFSSDGSMELSYRADTTMVISEVEEVANQISTLVG